jgi:XTP/dITP diphosphohydrolase
MILVGSRNAKKLVEVREILAPLGIRAVIAVNLPEVDEAGATFRENAAIKAKAYASFLRAPCLADDSGLVVPALGGEPGVRSARYAGEKATDEENLRLLLRRLDERGLTEPFAYFQCSIAIAVAGEEPRVVVEAEGRVEGHLVHEPRGSHGFGYDPIFLYPPDGCTTAEMDPDRKNAISHRGAALRALAEKLRDPALRAEIDP